MKRVIFNESVLAKRRMLNESLRGLEEIPDWIVDAINKGDTPISDSPALPDSYGDKLEFTLLRRRLEEVKEKISGIVIKTTPFNKFQKTVFAIEKMEEPSRDIIANICRNVAISSFDIPEGFVELNVNINNSADDKNDNLIQEDDDEEFEYDNAEEYSIIKKGIQKRKLINTIITGGAIRLAESSEAYVTDIHGIKPELCVLYKRCLALNDYLIVTKAKEDVKTDVTSEVNVSVGKEGNMSTIDVTGENFPFALIDTFKGLLELISTHGLPDETRIANKVLKNADEKEDEYWNFVFGPAIWDLLMEAWQDTDLTLFPYLFKSLVSLEDDAFFMVMKEVLAKTARAKKMFSMANSVAVKDKEEDSFYDRMSLKKHNYGVVEDDYIRPEDL